MVIEPQRAGRATLAQWILSNYSLLTEVFQLPIEQRAAIAGELIQSLDPEVDEDTETAWAEEIERRVQQIESGQAKTVPWSEVRRRLRLAIGCDPNA